MVETAWQVRKKLAEKGRNFAYIGVTDRDEAVGQQRKKGFMTVLHKNKISISDDKIKEGNFTMDSGYEKACELFETDPEIDSLLCATDTMAIGAITCIKEKGLRIPEDVQVVGIGDGALGKLIDPKLTTVHFYYKTSGMEAASMLTDLIESEKGIHKEIKMSCELVERDSHR